MRGFWVLLALCACGDDANTRSDAAVDTETAIDMMPDAPYGPLTLAETGLCVDAACTQIASGVFPYTPRYELYSDGATKRRWIYLPPGTTIDTSNMDLWRFPVGTKLWKEFTSGSTRVETRLVERIGAGDTVFDWFYASYVWNSTQDAATWAEFGQPDANGTQHDVPSKLQCRQCHENGRPSRVLGFGAIQLDFDGAVGDIDLEDAVTNNWLSNPPPSPGTPGDPYYPLPTPNNQYELPALGYLHANCGHCHNPNSMVVVNTPLQLRMSIAGLASIATMPAYVTAVGVTTQNGINGHNTIVLAGDPDMSVLIDRFESTNSAIRMPQLGVEVPDTAAQTVLRDWITNIP